MKAAIIGLGLLIIGILFIGPYVSRQKVCYDGSIRAINDINYQAASRGIAKDMICERRVVALTGLENCLRTATSGGQLVALLYPIIEGSLAIVRPVGKDLDMLKNEHNLECEEFPDFRTDAFREELKP